LRDKVKYDEDGNWAHTSAPERAKNRLTEAEKEEIAAKREEMAERGEQMAEPGEKMHADSDKADRWESSALHIESAKSDANKDGKNDTEKWQANVLRVYKEWEWGTIKEDPTNASGEVASQAPAPTQGTSSAADDTNAPDNVSGDVEAQRPAPTQGKEAGIRIKTTQKAVLDLGYATWRFGFLWGAAKKEPQPASAANDSSDNSNEPVVAASKWSRQNILDKVKMGTGSLNSGVELAAGKLSLEGTATYSATGPKSLNPFVFLGLDLNLLRARVYELDPLFGYDGKRIGFGLKAESGAVLGRAEGYGKATIPLGGYNLQLVGGIALAPMRLYANRIGAWIYYDLEDGRLYFGFTGMGRPTKMWADVIAGAINRPDLIPSIWVLKHMGIDFEGSVGRKAETAEEKKEREKKEKEKEKEEKKKQSMPGAYPTDDDPTADSSDQPPGLAPDDRYGSTHELPELPTAGSPDQPPGLTRDGRYSSTRYLTGHSSMSDASTHGSDVLTQGSAASTHGSITILQEVAPVEAAPALQRAAASTHVVAEEEEAPGLPSVNLAGLGIGIPGTIMAGNPTVRIGG